MATEEQKNNQQTLNDLLNDYKNGQIEAAEYTAVMTSRTADLSDALRKTVKLKKTSSELDKQLLGSVKRISDLARTLESPYTKISDVQKDIIKSQKEQIKLDNTLLALGKKLSTVTKEGTDKSQLDLANDYIALQDQVIKNEEAFEQARASASAQEKIYADELVTNERALQAELKKRDSLLEKINQKEFEANRELLEAKKKAEKDAINEISQLRQKQLEASQSLEAATKIKTELEISGAKPKEIEKAEAARLRAQQNYDISKEATLNKELQIKEITRDITSFTEESFTSKEKELLTSFETIKNLEKEKKATNEIIESNKSIDQTLVNQIVQKGVILDKSIDELATTEAQLSPEAKIYAQGKITSEINKTNTEYLETQGKHLNKIEKRQAAYNLTLGFAEGLLKKLGANNAAIALGLEEGKKAAEEMAKAIEEGKETSGIFGGQLKILGAGIKGTFKNMAEGLKPLALLIGFSALLGKALGAVFNTIKKMVILPLKGAFNALVSPAKKAFDDITGFASSFVDYITNSFLSIQGFVNTFKEGEGLIKELSQATEDIATGLGVSTSEAKQLTSQVRQFSGELGAFPEKLAQNMVELNQAFGTTQKFSDETARSFNRMVERLGFSTEEAAEFVKLSKLNGEEVNTTLGDIEDQTLALKNQYGIAVSQKSIFQDISKASSATRLSLGNNTKELTNAAFQAKRLGLEMDQVASMGSNLLEFESSIANEMEAELLIGRDLNLERARAAFLNNDIATAAEEIAGQIGSAADFSKMNVIQQEALAKAVGTNREGLADMLETQEMLANTGFKDMSEAQQEFNKLVESGMNIEQAQAKFRQKYGDEALAAQVAQVSYAKQKELQERKVLDAQAAMADAMMPVAEAMKRFHENLQAVRKVLIDQMRPFFKEFGGLIDDGGISFQKILKEYVTPLGKRLNDIGLTLVRFARENGPAIKQTFMSILDVFGSIYGLVGDIIKELFNIKGTSSVADPLKNALQLVQDIAKDIVSYVKSIDAGGIAEKIKNVITGIGNFYQGLYNFVKGTITTIRDAINYVKENPITTLLGVGATTGLAALLKRGSSRLFPMFTKNVDGPGGGMFKELRFKGLKDISNLAGGKKTAVGRILRSATAMAGKKSSIGSQILKGIGQSLGRIGSSLLSGAGAAGAGAAGAGAAGAGAAGAGAAGAGAMAALGPAAIGYAIGQVGKMAFDAAAAKKDAEIKVLDTKLVGAISEAEAARLEKLRDVAVGRSDELSKGGRIMAGAGTGAAAGALIGSAFFGIGAVPGALIGAGVGAAAAAIYEFSDNVRNSAVMVELFGKQAGTYSDEFVDNMRKTQQKLLRTQARIDAQRLANEKKQNAAIEQSSVSLVRNFESMVGTLDFDQVKSTNDGFQKFAQQMLIAGNITEEQFKDAINGVISPMDLLKTATQGASDRLSNAFTKVGEEADVKTQTAQEQARFDFMGKFGFDPEKALKDIATEASAGLNVTAFDTFIEANKNWLGDLGAREMGFVLTGQDSSQAGITAEQMTELSNILLGPMLKQIGDDKVKRELANEALIKTLDQIGKNAGDINLQSDEAQQMLKEQLPTIYEGLVRENKGLVPYIQNLLDIAEKGEKEKEKGQLNVVQQGAARTNISAVLGDLKKQLESDREGASKIVSQQLTNDTDLYKLLETQLGASNVTLESLLKDKKISDTEFKSLADALIIISEAAAITDPNVLNQIQSAFTIPTPVEDGTALSSKGPFTITDKFGATAVTAVGDGVVVSPNITHVNDAITDPVTGKVRGIIIPELQSLELDLDTLNAAIGLLQELLRKGGIPSYEGTQAQALLVDYKDGARDLVYNMERESINIARSVVNTIERMGAAEYLVEIGKQAGTVTETILQGSSPSGSYQNIQYQISKVQTVQDGSSISHNGPFKIEDSNGNVAITHPNDKLVVSPNVSYVSDGVSGKGGPVFPVSENFGALDVKVGKSGVEVQKIKDGVTGGSIQRIQDGGWWDVLSSGTDWVSSGLSEATKRTLEAAGWAAEQTRLIKEFGLETAQKVIDTIMDPENELKIFFHRLGSKFESWTVKLLEERLISDALRPYLKKAPYVGPLIDLAFEGYDLSQIADKQQMSLDDLYNKVGVNMHGFIGSILGGIAGDALGMIAAAGLTATGVGTLLAPAMPWIFNFLGSIAGQYLGEIIAENTDPKWMGKATADMFFPKTVDSLQQQDRLLAQSSLTPTQNVLDAASISNSGPFTIQDSRGNLAITHPKDKLVVSPNVSYVADGTTGKGGPVFPVSENFGALDVKVGKGGVLVQKINDGITGNPTQYINDGVSQDELFESYGISSIEKASTKTSTYKAPKTSSSGSKKSSSKEKSTTNDKGLSSETAKILEEKQKQQEQIANKELFVGESTLLKKNNIDSFQLQLLDPLNAFNNVIFNRTYYKDPNTGTSTYFFGQPYTSSGPTYQNPYLEQGITYSIFDQGDFMNILEKPNNSYASAQLFGMRLPSELPFGGEEGLQHQASKVGIDLTSNYEQHPEMMSSMMLVKTQQQQYQNQGPTIRQATNDALIPTVQYINDGITGITELKEAEKAGMPIDYQPGANLIGVRGPFTKISEVPEQEIGNRTYKGSGLFDKIYKLSSEEKTLRKELQHEYDEEFKKAYSLSKRGIHSTFAVEGIAPYTRTVDKFERIVNGLVKIENEAKSKGLPLLLHDVEAGYNDYGTTVQLGLTEGAGKVGYNESTRKNYVSMLLNTYVEPSKLFKNYTQPTPEPEVTESIIPEQVVGQGGERITIRGTEGDTFVTYENGKVVNSSTLREQRQPNISVAFDGIGGIIQKIKDGATASRPTIFKSVTGTTSDTRIGSSEVISQLGVPGVTNENFRNLFVANPTDGYFAGTLYTMGKENKLSLFQSKGSSPALDYFAVNYTDGKTDQILNEGQLSFPSTSYKANDISSIEASGNGLLAFARAMNEVQGVANKYTIGFQQDRESSAISFNSDEINNLTPTFNGIKEALLYKTIKPEQDHLVTGIPIIKPQVKGRGGVEEYITNILDNTSTHYIPLSMGQGNQAYDSLGIPHYDYSNIVRIINQIPQLDRTTDPTSSEVRNVETLYKEVANFFIPQYIERVGEFFKQYVDSEKFTTLKESIKPYIGAGFKWDRLFEKTEIREGGMRGASLTRTQGEYAEGSIQRVSDAMLNSELSKSFGVNIDKKTSTNLFTSTPQQIQDGSALSSRGPFTITDKFGTTAVTAKGDGVVVSPNISYVNDGIVDAEPMNQIATSSTQQHTTVIEQDNSELKKELEGMKQLMSELIKELPTIANRPITIELDGNKVGEGLGRIGYKG